MCGTHFYRSHHSRFVEKGAFKYVILDLLKDKPCHGYEVIRAMEAQFHGLYSPSAGSVYPTLNLLEDMGYVASSERNGKKVYTVTEEGCKYLSDESSRIDGIKERIKDFRSVSSNEDFRAAVREIREIGLLFLKHAGELNPDQWRRIRESAHHAYCEVADIIEQN